MTKTSKSTNKKPATPKGGRAAKQAAKPKTAPPPKTLSKHDKILTLLKRKDGASLEELQKVSGWQAHSVRGFLSSQVRKLPGVKLQSSKANDGVRRYTVVS